MSSYQKLLDKIVDAMKDAFAFAEKNEEVYTFEKSTYDVVTNMDFTIEKFLMERIREIEPEAVFLSEEYNPNTAASGRFWIIDPIDGTCNYANGISIFGIQCALCDEGETLLSAIYLPPNDESFTAISTRRNAECSTP